MADIGQQLLDQINADKYRVNLEAANMVVRTTTVVFSVGGQKQIVSPNIYRIYLLVVNDGASQVFVTPNTDAASGKGISLSQGNTTEHYWGKSGVLCQQNWYCFATGAANIYITEVVLQPGG